MQTYEYMENVSDTYANNARAKTLGELSREGWVVVGVISEGRRVVTMMQRPSSNRRFQTIKPILKE